MTERDEMNIEYVLSIGVNEIGDWILSMEDEQDMLYALSIIECAHGTPEILIILLRMVGRFHGI